MSTMQMLGIDNALRRWLGVNPGESIKEAAARLYHSPFGRSPGQRRAAFVLLQEHRGDPWGQMQRALDWLQ